MIRDLIGRLFAEPGIRYVREGVEYTPHQARKHLEAKIAAKKVTTVEDFIRGVASKSSTTGRSYRVLLPTGKGLDAESWWRTELQKLRQARQR